MRDQANSTALRAGYGVIDPSGTQLALAAINQGVIPSARMAASVQPTANDTVTIGGTVFKFVAALGAPAAQVQVLIGGSAAASYTNLVDAINGKASTSGTAWKEATTAFAKSVLADMVTATVLRLRNATARGGLALAGVSSSIALAAAITAGATAWTSANLNETGKAPSDCNNAYGQIAITAAMVAALAQGVPVAELGFAPTCLQWMVTSAAGAGKWTLTDTLTVNGNALILTSAGATHVVAGDILSYWAAA